MELFGTNIDIVIGFIFEMHDVRKCCLNKMSLHKIVASADCALTWEGDIFFNFMCSLDLAPYKCGEAIHSMESIFWELYKGVLKKFVQFQQHHHHPQKDQNIKNWTSY